MWFCTKDRNTRHDKPKATLILSQHKGGGELGLFAVTVRICTKITAEDNATIIRYNKKIYSSSMQIYYRDLS